MYDKVINIMREKNITQKELAKRAGISRPDISKALNGVIPLYGNWKKKIAEALEMSEDEIF